MCGEFWAGWFDTCGEKHSTTPVERAAAALEWMLSRGMSVSLCLFHGGTSFEWLGVDDFLKEEGIFEEAQAVKEVVAWQLAEAMKKRKISKNRMATLLKTSRTQVDRLLDAKDDITLSSLQRAAAIVGRRVTIKLV